MAEVNRDRPRGRCRLGRSVRGGLAVRAVADMSDLSRGELGIQMLCAWNNIPRDKAPASWSEHHNEWTRDAWARVAEAAIRHHAANSDSGVEPVACRWRETDDQSFSYGDTENGLRLEGKGWFVEPLFAHPPAKALDGITVKEAMKLFPSINHGPIDKAEYRRALTALAAALK